MLDNPVKLCLYGLALFRGTILLYREKGPWNIFSKLREKAGIQIVEWLDIDERDVPHTIQERKAEGFWAELLNCPYCLSGWLAILAAIGYKSKLADFIALWLALWGVVYWLIKLDEKE